jgi:hypothetical protein
MEARTCRSSSTRRSVPLGFISKNLLLVVSTLKKYHGWAKATQVAQNIYVTG